MFPFRSEGASGDIMVSLDRMPGKIEYGLYIFKSKKADNIKDCKSYVLQSNGEESAWLNVTDNIDFVEPTLRIKGLEMKDIMLALRDMLAGATGDLHGNDGLYHKGLAEARLDNLKDLRAAVAPFGQPRIIMHDHTKDRP